MDYYGYYDQVLQDGKDAIDEMREDPYGPGTFEDVYDALFIDDSVTGNGSGSYTFNSATAKEYVEDAPFDSDILRAFNGLGIETNDVANKIANGNYEDLDVCIRCALLGEASGELQRYFEYGE